MTRKFQKYSVTEFLKVIKFFPWNGEGKTEIHVHHTWRPTKSQYVGERTIWGMWNYHVNNNGWADIAQHISIAPDGTIWTGRDWNKTPVSAYGYNHPAVFMMEIIGDFDIGRDVLDGEQLNSTLAAVAGIQELFALPLWSSVKFHNQMSSVKTCPGSSINRTQFIINLRNMHETLETENAILQSRDHAPDSVASREPTPKLPEFPEIVEEVWDEIVYDDAQSDYFATLKDKEPTLPVADISDEIYKPLLVGDLDLSLTPNSLRQKIRDDNTTVHPTSISQKHIIDLFAFKGAPLNLDPDNPVQILVNHGYVCGYSPNRYQPSWCAYRIANATRDVKYDRPHIYYADKRISADMRLSKKTFGKHKRIAYHVGHMVPNDAINTQFGRLAQLETFFMSNMSPQRGTLNTGVWLDLENKIRKIEYTKDKDHVWAFVGTIFGEAPETISRDGVEVPIPSHYFCVMIDPHSYPFDTPSSVEIAAFIIPQEAPKKTPLSTYEVTLDEVEAATKLDFFPGWRAEFPETEMRAIRKDVKFISGDMLDGEGVKDSNKDMRSRHRLLALIK